MEREKTVQRNIRVQPKIKALVCKHAEGAHGLLITKALKFYLKHMSQKSE
jgi:hypothetical protein